MYHLAFNQEEKNTQHSDLYLLMQEFVHEALLNEIGVYLGDSMVKHIQPESERPQMYLDPITTVFDRDKIMRLLPDDVLSWLIANGIDPVVFIAKKLAQLVRIIKEDFEEDPDLLHKYLISKMGDFSSPANEILPFKDRHILVDGLIDYYDNDDTEFENIDRQDFIKICKDAFRNLHGLVTAEYRWDVTFIFETDDHEFLDAPEGPVIGLSNLYISYNEYSRPYFEFMFNSVGEHIPADLQIQLDIIAEFAMKVFRLSIQQEILINSLDKDASDHPDYNKMS